MMQYHTNLRNTPPAADFSRMASMQSPYRYGQNHDDVFSNMLNRSAIELDRYAQQNQDQYGTKQQQAAMDAALQGMQMLSQDQQNQRNLENSRLSMMLNFQNQLLGGLLR